MNPFRSLGLVGWLVVGIVALVIIAAGLWWAGGGARRDAAVAKAAAAMSASRAASGAEAGAILDQAHAAATDNETLSRENADAIRKAPGADQALDPGLNDAGRRSLCKRASLRDTDQCVQLLGPRKPAR